MNKIQLALDEEFELMVLKAIMVSKMRRVLHEGYRKGMSPQQWAHQFCTVKIDIGRGTGKTKFITKHADQRSLVIVHSNLMSEIIKRENTRPDIFGGYVLEMQTSRVLSRLSAYDTVYVDETSKCFRNINILYDVLATDGKDRTFILLGN